MVGDDPKHPIDHTMTRNKRTVVYWSDGLLAEVEEYADQHTNGAVSPAVRELTRRGLQSEVNNSE